MRTGVEPSAQCAKQELGAPREYGFAVLASSPKQEHFCFSVTLRKSTQLPFFCDILPDTSNRFQTMKRLPGLLAALFLLMLAMPSSTCAAFTGEMQMSLAMPNGKAVMTYLFGARDQKMDMTMMIDRIPEPLRTTVITRSANPDEATIVNHKSRSWSVVNLRSAAESATLLDFDSNYRFSRVGTETLSGYQCEHVRLTSSTDTLDLWITRGLGNFSTFRLLQSQNPRLSNTSLSKVLKENGVDGFPVKIVQQNGNGLYAMELKKVTPKAVADSNFQYPAGYQKVEAGQTNIDSQQKEHLRQLMNKMKKFEQ
jgi:hypothetical protein